jgi:subfamily B ATP-binding cassette protein MsbA
MSTAIQPPGAANSATLSKTHTPFWRTARRLLSYVRPYRAVFLGGIAGAILFAAVSSSLGALTQLFLDGTFLRQDPRMLALAPVGLVALFLLRGIGDYTQSYCMGYVGRRVVEAVRTHAFAHMLDLPISHYDRSDAGSLLSRITYQSELVAQTVTDSAVTAVRESLTVVATFIYLFWLNAGLTALALVTVPAIAWLVHSAHARFRRFSFDVQHSVADLTGTAKEALDAPRTVRVYNATGYRKGLFGVANLANRRANMRLIRARALLNPVIQLVAAIAVSGVLYVATKQAVHGTLTVGQFTAFIVMLLGVSQPIRGLVGITGPLQQGLAAGEELFTLLDEPPEPRGGTTRTSRTHGDVEFRQVGLRYDGADVSALSNVSFSVRRGQTVALVGRSGSGKTSIVSLLPRFYDPTDGSITLDGLDLRDFDLDVLRSQISFVAQDVVLFNDTIRNNIRLGWSATDSEIERSAERAHVLEFARDLPQGLDAPVGDRGVLLSGGQKQRISIARALLRDAPILILDEATSALDAHSEALITASIDELRRDRTTFVVAHRIATVENADVIVVLRNGRVVETGTHAELIGQGGEYAGLHRAQFDE